MSSEVNRNHPAILLKHPLEQDYEVMIDVMLVDLIMACWQLRIGTAQSCQCYNEQSDAWIRFATSEDAIKFFKIILPVSRGVKWFTATNPIPIPEVFFPYSEIHVITEALQKARNERVRYL